MPDSSLPVPRASSAPERRHSQRPIDAELRLLREAHVRSATQDVRAVARELRAKSEMPRPRAEQVETTIPELRSIPTDLAESLRAPPGLPLPRTPHHTSTSPEGTLGAEVDPVVYYEHQHATWRRLLGLQTELTRGRTSAEYSSGREKMNVFANSIPSLADVDAWLSQHSDWRIVRANGYVEPQRFLSFVSRGLFPCMDLLRHEDEILYSPEPDMYHDLIGHLPMLCTPRFGEYTRTFGRAGTNVRHPEQLQALNRIYWFTMEFGLLEQRGEGSSALAYGAALLTGLSELLTSGGDAVERVPFRIDDVIACETDVHRPNDVLFVVKDLEDLLACFVDWASSERLL